VPALKTLEKRWSGKRRENRPLNPMFFKEKLLALLMEIKVNFLLLAYSSQVLSRYIKNRKWAEILIIQPIAVNARKGKQKLNMGMLVANNTYQLEQNYSQLLLKKM
jgi:hypothetical protein